MVLLFKFSFKLHIFVVFGCFVLQFQSHEPSAFFVGMPLETAGGGEGRYSHLFQVTCTKYKLMRAILNFVFACLFIVVKVAYRHWPVSNRVRV